MFAHSSSEPEGLRYAAEFVSPATERELIDRIAGLPLQPFQFGQYEGKRRVAWFGFEYDYALRRLQDADPIPECWVRSSSKSRHSAGPKPGSGKSFAPNTMSESASAGTGTSIISTGYSACPWDRPVSSGFGGLPARSGSALRSMPNRGRST